MKRGNNIFYGLTRENENTATEMLCNLLQVKYVRDVCLQFLGFEAIEGINSQDITSQHSLEDGGIPDIKISNSDCYYLIENKIRKDTPLQPSQITTYITKIKNSSASKKGYIFIIPKDYKHEDMIKIDTLIEENKPYLTIKKIYWHDLLVHLYSKELDHWSLLIAHSLEFLSDLILGQTTDTRFTPYEVAMLYNPKEAYEAIKMAGKVFQLIKEIETVMLEELGTDFKAGDEISDIWSKSNWEGKIGKYFRYKEKPAIFCGLSYDLLDENNPQYNDFVFSIAFKRDKLNPELKIDEIKYPKKEVNGWLYIRPQINSVLDEGGQQSITFKKNIIDIIKNVFLSNLKEDGDQ